MHKRGLRHRAVSTCMSDQQTLSRYAPVTLVYDRKPERYAEEKRTEFSCMHW